MLGDLAEELVLCKVPEPLAGSKRGRDKLVADFFEDVKEAALPVERDVKAVH